ncbi:hypothetical protein FSPOR_6296 [Fusarium sporotrichioides]|uniref:Uncharacterized protein n=1 Tax=Fusarium sporotrichioides TaxID=5514 RepID=A0A395S3J0_FUSSP|nr:hypothetical protein FSPOR_6296 [Fusarium sporotrichioides]
MSNESSSRAAALKYNIELTDHINNLVDSGDEQIKQVIARLCHNMLQFSEFVRLWDYQNIAFHVWLSFLPPIKALMKLSHPQRNFIAARMVLYLGFQIHRTFDETTYFDRNEDSKRLCNLCIELDDTLLEPLKNIWKVSNNLEDFNWAFVDDRIHSARNDTVMEDSDLKIA